MKRISQLVLGCCYLLCFSGALIANEVSDKNQLDETAPSSQNISLSSEETQYILQECEGFANDDGISEEDRADYIVTCFTELSVAVKNAMEKLRSKPELTANDQNENNAAKDEK